jgi:sulfite reductase (NADPH) flavoprotein alpha-component
MAMTAIPLLPNNAPFSPEDIDVLNSVVAHTTPNQRSWLAGFFAGFEAALSAQQQPQPAAARPRAPLTVLCASESGNAEVVALNANKGAPKHKLDVRVPAPRSRTTSKRARRLPARCSGSTSKESSDER